VRRLIGNGEEARMPMALIPSCNQIKLIRAWIDQNLFVVAPEPAAPVAAIEPVAGHAQQDESGVFASKIRPILAARCYSCHGPTFNRTACGWILCGSFEGQRQRQRGDSRRWR